MKKLSCLFLFLLLTITFTWSQQFDFLPRSKNKIVITHAAFVLSFIEKYKEAEWVAYPLTRQMLQKNVERETGKFMADPMVLTGSAMPKDYTKSGYDRGHLCPANDMVSSETLMKECFYMSNMSPQTHPFNAGIWKKLEILVRKFVKTVGKIYVVTGPIFGDNMKFIGNPNQIAVPPKFYKVILYYQPGKAPKAIGFILPHENSRDPLMKFAVSIDEVEKTTGIDFFPALPDDIERKIESNINPEDWGFTIPVAQRD